MYFRYLCHDGGNHVTIHALRMRSHMRPKMGTRYRPTSLPTKLKEIITRPAESKLAESTEI